MRSSAPRKPEISYRFDTGTHGVHAEVSASGNVGRPKFASMDIVNALKVLVRVTQTFLDERFGVRPLHRTTRKLSLTDDGQMLLHLARPVLEGIGTMEAAMARAIPAP